MRRPLIVYACLLMWPGMAVAHAFPERSVPGAGATLKQAPDAVTVYFDARPEPVFSKLVVRNEQGIQVGEGGIDPANPMALRAGLPAVKQGTYRVHWSVVSRDGHRTEGDYTFTVQ